MMDAVASRGVTLPADDLYELQKIAALDDLKRRLMAWASTWVTVLSIALTVAGAIGGTAVIQLVVEDRIDKEAGAFSEKVTDAVILAVTRAKEAELAAQAATAAADNAEGQASDIAGALTNAANSVSRLEERLANITVNSIARTDQGFAVLDSELASANARITQQFQLALAILGDQWNVLTNLASQLPRNDASKREFFTARDALHAKNQSLVAAIENSERQVVILGKRRDAPLLRDATAALREAGYGVLLGLTDGDDRDAMRANLQRRVGLPLTLGNWLVATTEQRRSIEDLGRVLGGLPAIERLRIAPGRPVYSDSLRELFNVAEDKVIVLVLLDTG